MPFLLFFFLTGLLALRPATAAEAPPIYASNFRAGFDGWRVQWTESGKLATALDAALPGPSGAPSLRTTLAEPSTGTVGVNIPVQGARQWRIRYWACARYAAGEASLNLQCHDAAGKQVAWIAVGDIPQGEKLKQVTAVVQIPENVASLNMLILHGKVQGETHLADVRIDELRISPALLARVKPKGPTRWGATSFFKKDDVRLEDTILKLMAAAGVTHTRGWIDWRSVEPEKGRYDFSVLDGQLAQAARYGCRMDIVCIHGTPSWASGKSGAADLPEERKRQGQRAIDRAFWAPRDWGDWRRFVFTLARHYRGQGLAWEILNEPDLWSEGCNASYEDYRNYLRIAYQAAKQADPTCRVFTAAFVFDRWLPMLLADGMGAYFDGVCVHPYGNAPDECAARLRKTQLTLLAAGVPRETWVTEVGYQSGGWKGGPGCLHSEAEKSAKGQQTLSLLSKDAGLVCWYTAVEAGQMYGLLRLDRDRVQPMPIYSQYGALTGKLRPEGGPIQITAGMPAAPVARGTRAVIRLRAVNTGKKTARIRFWPVGFVAALGPDGDNPAALDWEGTLAPGAAHEALIPVTPTAQAAGEYPVGLAVITPEGNSLRLETLTIAP